MPPLDRLPPSPIAWRRYVSFDMSDPKQGRPLIDYLTQVLARLQKGREEHANEFDRVVADVEAWIHQAYVEAGVPEGHAVGGQKYPQAIWYASQMRSLISEIRRTLIGEPDLATALAVYLGELVGEARAELRHGPDAARGVKTKQSAKSGHEQVYGTAEKKAADRAARLAAFERYRASGCSVTRSEGLAADELGVHPKSIFNARKAGARR